MSWCWIFGHSYFVRRELNHESRCLGCHRCPRFWAMNDSVRALLEWDADFTELYGYTPTPERRNR